VPADIAWEPALRAFIPRAVLAHADAGQAAWLAEFRHVTVLFMHVPAMDYATPDALERSQTLLRTAQTVVRRYEGAIHQFLMDDKWTTLIAAWGLPALTHEDDAKRAVQAVLDLHDQMHTAGFAVGIGMATGRVFCGERGGAQRREYAMLGQAVNLAARLREQAGEGVLVDGATVRAAVGRYEFEALEPVALKGIGDRVPVFRPQLGMRSTVPKERELIGRGDERRRVAERLSALRAQRTGGVLLVAGEPGIGKSSLLQYALDGARGLGLRCLTSAGVGVEQATPYFVWRAVLAGLLGAETRDVATVRREVLAALRDSPTLLSRAPLLNAVLPLDLPDTEISAQMTGSSRADAIRDLIVHLLAAAAADAPTLVGLDDGHWFDSASWGVVLAVARRVPTLLLFVTTRPIAEPAPAEHAVLLGAAGVESMHLEAMPDACLLSWCGCRRAPPADVADFVRDKAEGNPFFTEQLVYSCAMPVTW
jgi:class 3 adenylate cyclase